MLLRRCQGTGRLVQSLWFVEGLMAKPKLRTACLEQYVVTLQRRTKKARLREVSIHPALYLQLSLIYSDLFGVTYGCLNWRDLVLVGVHLGQGTFV